MAKTLKERAEEYAMYDNGIDKQICEAYKDGATDQRKIDIEKACSLTGELVESVVKVLTNNLDIDFDVQTLKTDASNDMRKAMEEE